MVAYRSLPEVCRYVPFEPMDADEVASRIGGVWSQTTMGQEGDSIVLGAELVGTGQVIGDVMLRWDSEIHRRAEIGYVFAPAFGGQGYATEAGHALLHLAFDELGFRRVIARVDSRNQPSVRVVERLGMRLEAHLVENEWFKGEWSDELDFALLESEWLSRNYPGCPDCPPGGRGDRS